MNQEGLFGAATVRDEGVKFSARFSAWQNVARRLLAAGRAPDSIWWQPDSGANAPEDRTPEERAATAGRGEQEQQPSVYRVPRQFPALARQASYHSAADRWALLYSLLWRLTHDEPQLLELAGDHEVVRLHAYVNAVNRDIHKMKAFVRFREVGPCAAVSASGNSAEQRYVAWFEPDHNTVEPAARFFRDRFSNMRWSILTPTRCAHWEGTGELWFSPGVKKHETPSGDAFEEAWRTYYANIFNPARIKLNAMRSEMPQKYWKNLPEAHLIGKLVQEAPARVAAMQKATKSHDRLNCGQVPASPNDALIARQQDPSASELVRLAAAASACQSCTLWQPATQTVFGVGPENARVMLLGEQPGDAEDLCGTPFVGPAGKLLNDALNCAGLYREELYLTNVVKHFKFDVSKRHHGGKMRIHKSPAVAETEACRHWLDAELALVQPEIVVCLGATAARSQLGQDIKLVRDRGQWFKYGERLYLPTLHPAFVLRSRDKSTKQERFSQLVSDLQVVAAQQEGRDRGRLTTA